MDSPCQWTKQVASHWGGTRNGTIVRWPRGIQEKGGIRSKFSGKIHRVQIDRGKDDNDHYIDPEARLRIATTRQ